MKKLFSIECDGLFFVEEENAVYSIYDDTWTFIDSEGKLLDGYVKRNVNYEEYDESDLEAADGALIYNKYGIACDAGSLVDIEGERIPDVSFNLIDDCGEENRYFTLSLLSEEQMESMVQFGGAENVTVDVYDTKKREYVAKGVPECILYLNFFDGEPEVVLEAIKLLESDEVERVTVHGKGTIITENDGVVTVYDYYRE